MCLPLYLHNHGKPLTFDSSHCALFRKRSSRRLRRLLGKTTALFRPSTLIFHRFNVRLATQREDIMNSKCADIRAFFCTLGAEESRTRQKEAPLMTRRRSTL